MENNIYAENLYQA